MLKSILVSNDSRLINTSAFIFIMYVNLHLTIFKVKDVICLEIMFDQTIFYTAQLSGAVEYTDFISSMA